MTERPQPPSEPDSTEATTPESAPPAAPESAAAAGTTSPGGGVVPGGWAVPGGRVVPGGQVIPGQVIGYHWSQQPKRGKGAIWRFWPSPPDAAPAVVFGLAALTAVVTAVTEPYATTGMAGLLTGLTVAAGPLAVALTSRAACGRLLRPLPILSLCAVMALLATGTLRAASWLYVLCVLTAFGFSSYALAAGRRWPGVFVGGAAVPIGLLRGLPWLMRGVRQMAERATRAVTGHQGRPAAGAGRAGEGRSRMAPADVFRMLAVLVGTVFLLLVFGLLFASADAVFDRMLADLIPELSPELAVRTWFGLVMAGFALGACFVARVPPRTDRLASTRPGRARRIEWLVPLVPLVLLFAGFVAVQLTVLFGGHAHVLQTAGLTYAEYARRGFGELVAVTVLTLLLLAGVARWAPRQSRTDRVLLRVVPGALCLLTLVIVASALYRMHLYQEAYGFTRLRLVVDAFELWLGVVFVLILAAGARLRGGWLPRTVVGAGVAALLLLGALNPDAFIAERNAARFADSQRIDVGYLSDLSADAVPALDRLPEPHRSCALAPIERDLREPDPWYAYNASRERARELLKRHPVTRDVECDELTYRGD